MRLPNLYHIAVQFLALATIALSSHASVVFFVQAKGTGSVTVTINGYSTTANFSGSTSTWNQPISFGAAYGTPTSLQDGVEYICSATSTGVTDFMISFARGPQDDLYIKRRITINDKYVGSILKNELVAGQFRIKQDWLANTPFGVMDDSGAAVQKTILFGMGADSADSPAGILIYQRASHLGGLTTMRFHRSPGTLWSFSNSTRIQARSSYGFLDAVASGSSWTIRYYKDRGPGNPYPKPGDFYDFSGGTPLTVYQLDALTGAESYPHPDGSFSLAASETLNVSRTVGTDTRVREIQTSKYTKRVLTAAYYSGSYPYQYWTERYMNWHDNIVRTWPWRKASASRGAITETTVKITFEEVIQYGPAGQQTTYHPTFVDERRLDGSTHGSPVIAREYRGYSGTSVLQYPVPATGKTGGIGSEEMSLGGLQSDVGPNGSSWLPGGSVRTDARGGKVFTEVYRFPTPLYAGNLNGQPATALGKTKEIRTSFGDNATGTSTDIIKSYEYVEVAGGAITLPWRVITKQGSLEIGRETMSYSVGSFGGFETVLTTRVVSTGPAASLTSYKLAYSPRVANADLREKTLSETQPDFSKKSYAYQRGILWNGVWYPASGGAPTQTIPAGAHLLVAELQGKSGSGIASFTPSGSPSGIAVDPLDMEGGRSLVVEKIYDAQGDVLRDATYIYTGASFALMRATYNTYDDLGRLLTSANAPSITSDTLVFREISYADGSGNPTWSTQWERDERGVKTVVVCDAYGRVQSTTREASGNSSSSDYIPAATTTLVYDGADRIKQRIVSVPGTSETLVTSFTYDTVGRKKTETAPGGYLTSISYDSAVQTSTVAKGNDTGNPQNSTAVEVYWKDGRKKSVAGDAVPDVTYTYAYDASGNLVTTETLGTGAWSKTTRDWIDRVAQVEKPTWAASGAAGTSRFEKYEYNSYGQLYATGSWQGATLLAPKHLRGYDAYGRLLQEAVDTNNNGGIDTSLDLGVVQHHFMYETKQMNWFDTGVPINSTPQWYLFQAELIWGFSPDVEPGAVDRSGEWTSGSQKYQQISGLTASVAVHEFGRDPYVNWTQSVTQLDRANQKAITQTHTGGSNIRALSESRAGFEVQRRNPQGHTTLISYDGFGRMIATSEQRISTPTSYDYVAGTAHLESITSPDGKVTTYGYDRLGRKEWERNNNLKNTRYRYDNAGNLTHVWGEVARPVMYGYNDNNQRTAMYTYRGGTWTSALLPVDFSSTGIRDATSWTYHGPTGLMERKTDALGRYTSFQFDAMGRISQRRDSRGDSWITTYEYFHLGNSNLSAGEFQGNLKKVDYTDPVGTPDVSYTYERRGRVRTVTDYTGTRSFNYYDSWTAGTPTEVRDRSRLLQAETLPAFLGGRTIRRDYQFAVPGRRNAEPLAVEIDNSSTYRVSYTYDDVLRFASAQYMSDTPFTYQYLSNANLIDQVRQGTSTAYSYLRDYDYESLSNRVSHIVSRPAYGSGADARQVETYVGYTNLGLRDWEKTGGTTYSATLGRGNFGNRAGFGYNDRQELNNHQRWEMNGAWNDVAWIAAANRSFTYDPIGNRTADQAGGYSPVAMNQYSGTPYGSSPAYDWSGNMTSDGMGRTYEYDGENRLTRITQGGRTINYRYDYLGRRVSKTTSDGADIRFIYDGWNLIAEMNGSGTITRHFAWGLDITGTLQGGGGIGGLLVIADGGTRFMPFYDGAANVIGLYDGSGTIRAAYEYDAYGNIAVRGGNYAAGNPFRHATKYVDWETEITLTNQSIASVPYYGYRFYHTAFGRFINRDPVEETGGLNLYGFCENNPANNWDYLGHEDVEQRNPFDVIRSVGGIPIDPKDRMSPAAPTSTEAPKPGDTVEQSETAKEQDQVAETESPAPEDDDVVTLQEMTITETRNHRYTRAYNLESAIDSVNGARPDYSGEAWDTFKLHLFHAVVGMAEGARYFNRNDAAYVHSQVRNSQRLHRALEQRRAALAAQNAAARPSFVYDAAARRYRDTATGRFVAARDLPWPGNQGFTSGAPATLRPGVVIDRFGSTSGRYAGTPGATVAQRGMAQGADAMPYAQFDVIKPIPVRVGPAAPVPAFGAEGGATQFLFDVPISELVKQGALRPR